MADLLAHFAEAVARAPGRVALVDGRGRATTFAALDARIRALAAGWRAQGIGPGDRVLLAMPLNADLYASLAALWSLGATVVLPEPAMGLAGLRHAARVTAPKAFCAAGPYALLRLMLPALWGLPLLRPVPPLAAAPPANTPPRPSDEVALISFTSGTTGAPKAIPRSHGFLLAQYRAVAPLLASADDERDLVAFPVFTLINLAEARTSVLPAWRMSRLHRLTPAALAGWIGAQGVTRALLPPALCETLAKAGPGGPLRQVFTGGGPVFPDLVDRLRAQGRGVTCVYGSTEAEPIAHLEATTITEADRAAMAAGQGLLVGHPVPEVRLRIDADEVLVAGDHVNRGYLDPSRDAETKRVEDGVIWHRTGDAGRLDASGRLWLWGRVGSGVARPGGTLYPFAVEVAARSWPGARASALLADGPRAVLAVAGEARHLPDWQAAAQAFGIDRVVPVRALPMDRRHRSKVDRAALARQVLGPAAQG